MSSRLLSFSLKRDFEPGLLKMVKLKQSFEGRNKVEYECPVANGVSIEVTLYILSEFLESAAEKLQFDTGQNCLTIFV